MNENIHGLFDPGRYDRQTGIRIRARNALKSSPAGGSIQVVQPEPLPLVVEEQPGGRYRRDNDGLLARSVKAHSERKAYYVRRFADAVGSGMRSKFPEIWWVELFAGPGRLFVEPLGEFVNGSPLDALGIKRPFSGYVFSDLDADCVEALSARVVLLAARPRGALGVHHTKLRAVAHADR